MEKIAQPKERREKNIKSKWIIIFLSLFFISVISFSQNNSKIIINDVDLDSRIVSILLLKSDSCVMKKDIKFPTKKIKGFINGKNAYIFANLVGFRTRDLNNKYSLITYISKYTLLEDTIIENRHLRIESNNIYWRKTNEINIRNNKITWKARNNRNKLLTYFPFCRVKGEIDLSLFDDVFEPFVRPGQICCNSDVRDLNISNDAKTQQHVYQISSFTNGVNEDCEKWIAYYKGPNTFLINLLSDDMKDTCQITFHPKANKIIYTHHQQTDSIKCNITNADGRKEGWWIEEVKYTKGEYEIKEYVNGKKNGKYIYVKTDLGIMLIGHYKNDERHGLFKNYIDNQISVCVCKYKKDKLKYSWLISPKD